MLNIRRLTPAAGQLINLLDRDVGQPLVHIATTLSGADLVDMAAQPAMHGTQHRGELRHEDGRDFLVTVMPYRTARGEDDGMVLTFVDVSDLKRSVDRTQQVEARYRALVHHLPNGITLVYDRALNVIEVAGPGLQLTGQSTDTLVGQPVARLLGAGGADPTAALLAVFAGRSEQILCRLGGRDLLVSIVPVASAVGGEPSAGMAVAQDITALRGSLGKLAHGEG